MSNLNKNDPIYSPRYYKEFGFENLNLMREIFREDMYKVYVCNFLKYLIRYEFKDAKNDLDKANFFLCEIITCTLKNNFKNTTLTLEQMRAINEYIAKISRKNSYLSQIIRMFIRVFLCNENPTKEDIKNFEKDFFIFCVNEKQRLRRRYDGRY